MTACVEYPGFVGVRGRAGENRSTLVGVPLTFAAGVGVNT
jgi:hypothetical protein